MGIRCRADPGSRWCACTWILPSGFAVADGATRVSQASDISKLSALLVGKRQSEWCRMSNSACCNEQDSAPNVGVALGDMDGPANSAQPPEVRNGSPVQELRRCSRGCYGKRRNGHVPKHTLFSSPCPGGSTPAIDE